MKFGAVLGFASRCAVFLRGAVEGKVIGKNGLGWFSTVCTGTTTTVFTYFSFEVVLRTFVVAGRVTSVA